MADSIDVYYQWLGIPPKDQPPNHYRLLSIELFETNPDVIDNSATRQMAHVRTFQSGKHAAESQRLLNEISAARLCLLDANKKAAYDAKLKSQLGASEPSVLRAKPLPMAVATPIITAEIVTAEPVPLVAPPPNQFAFLNQPPMHAGSPTPVAKPKPVTVKKSRQQPLVLAGIVAGSLLLLALGGTLAMFAMRPAPKPVAQPNENAKPPVDPTHKPGVPPTDTKPPPSAIKPPLQPTPQPENPFQPVPALQGPDVRTLWRYDNVDGGGTFEKLPEGWVETKQGNPAWRRVFEETLRTPEFVEFRDSRGGQSFRLYDNKLEFQGRTGPWRPQPHIGKWVTAGATNVAARPPTTPATPDVSLKVSANPTVKALGPPTLSKSQAGSGESYALVLEGRDQHVELLNAPSLRLLNQPFTAEAWLRVPNYSPSQFLFGDWTTLGNTNSPLVTGWFVAAKEDGDQVEYQFVYGRSVTKGLGPKIGTNWFHLAAGFSPRGNRVEAHLHVNGSQVAQANRSLEGPVVPSPRGLYLGCSPFAPNDHKFTGAIREFRVSSGVRYSGNFTPPPAFERDASTLVLLDFAHGNAETLKDATANGHDGRINGGRWVVVKELIPSTAVAANSPAVNPFEPETPATQPVPVIPAAPAKVAVPSASEQAAAQKQIKDILKSEYEKATKPDTRLALANLLAKQADDEKNAATKYVLLTETRDLASQAGDLALATAAIDRLEKAFETDGLGMRVETLRRFTAEKSTTDVKRRLAEVNLDLAVQLAQAHRYKEARDSLTTVLSLARAAKDADLLKTATQREKAIKLEEQQWTAVAAAKKTLTDSPNDPKANQTYGQYLCFLQGDWETGLAHLAKGADTTLADLAKKDLENPADDAGQTQLGDGWYDLGQKGQDPQKNGALSRAQYWYGKVQPQLTGLTKAKVDKRLEELASVVTAVNPGAAAPARYPWLTAEPGPGPTLDGHTRQITGLDVSRSGRLLASNSHDGTLRLWDLSSLKQLHEIKLSRGSHDRGVVFSPDEKFVIASSDDEAIGVWRVDNAQPATAIKSLRSPCDVRVSSDGRKLVWNIQTYNRPSIFVWNVPANRLLGQVQSPGTVHAFDISEDAKTLITAESNNQLQVWDLATGKSLNRLTGHDNDPRHVALTLDGRFAASSDYQEVRIWDVKGGKSLNTIKITSPRGVAFSRDGRRLAVAGVWELAVYDVEKGTSIFRRQDTNFRGRLSKLKFTSDPRGLVTATDDGSIRLWRLPD